MWQGPAPVTLPETEAAPAPGTRRRAGRIAARLAAAALAVVAAAALAAWLALRASLPVLDGELRLAGLDAPVEVTRDALGVPTVRGASRLDAACATGFLHAQDRFFQMDLLRRRAAGELAELFGGVALKWDRAIRVHRFRTVAERSLAGAAAEERALLEAYTAGVNAGLAALAARPFEYLMLRAAPVPWRAEDTVLVLLSMFIELQDHEDRHESDLGVLHEVMPAAVAELLAPVGTSWDAPLVGATPTPPPLPSAEVLDLRRAAAAPRVVQSSAPRGGEPDAVGSNNWAVAGSRTAHGGAIVANDMHLGIDVPNTWYRAVLIFPAQRNGGETRLAGLTLPGTPAVVVGSNGHVAWGFTNSYGDFEDLVVVEQPPGDDETYLAADGPHRIEHAIEPVRVRGGAAVTLDVASTIWGPIVDRDLRGRRRSLRWTAHDPEAVGFGLLRVEGARTVDEAVAAANASGIPAQNLVCADDSGRIAWTIAGRIPRRVGHDGRFPTSWRDGSRRWDGLLAPGEAPRIVDPPAGVLWTANARTLDGVGLALLGDGGYGLGARARQIRDGLAPLARASEADMLRLQLDDSALFLARWQRLLLEVLSPEAVAGQPRRAEARELVAAWGAHAAVDSAGYRIVRAFRLEVVDETLTALTAPCRAADKRFSTRSLAQAEDAVWHLVTERPPHLLDPRFGSWSEQLLAALDTALGEIAKDGKPLADHPWGERNTVAIRHPLSGAVPGLFRLLDMPAVRLPGDSNMPRFQSPRAGASERLAVSPGREAQGYLHMPCGQSGHPLSPFYRAGHAAWVDGDPTPFLPGPPAHTLHLVP
jgi:penicillin G amidase